MKKIIIIDYGLGNLYSVSRACQRVNIPASISANASEVEKADAIILPGVGAFGDAMSNLESNGMALAIKEFASNKKPIFGICLGLQLLFDSSEEFGDFPGLSIISGTVNRLPVETLRHQNYKVPHVGWNNACALPSRDISRTPLFAMKPNEFMYFVHSFYASPLRREDWLTETVIGNFTFCSSILKDNIFACQFHPEKSGEAGLTIYKSWYSRIQQK